METKFYLHKLYQLWVILEDLILELVMGEFHSEGRGSFAETEHAQALLIGLLQ